MKTSVVEKQVDALIKRGYYPNRAEFLEDAIRAFIELRKEMEIAVVVELYKKGEVKDDPTGRCTDITKAKEIFGWKPKIRPKEGLKRAIAYFGWMK